MFIPASVWGDTNMNFGKKDPNDVSSNNSENHFQPHLLLEVICKVLCSCRNVWWSSSSFPLSLQVHCFLAFNHSSCSLSKGASKCLSTEDIEQNSSLGCLCLLRNSCDDWSNSVSSWVPWSWIVKTTSAWEAWLAFSCGPVCSFLRLCRVWKTTLETTGSLGQGKGMGPPFPN